MNDTQTIGIQLDFAKFELHENYIVSTVFENILIGEKYKSEIINLLKKYYPKKNFGYISDRVYNYSTKLTNFLNLENIQNFKGMAVVYHSPLQKRAALLEREICAVPFELFDSLEKAKSWVNSLV